MNRRELVSGLGSVAFAGAFARPSFAQSLSGGTIRLVVMTAPGGITDLAARLIAEAMGPKLEGATVVVENRPGASGIIAAEFVARQPADGRSILIMTTSLLVLPATKKAVSTDPRKDLDPVTNLFVGDWLFALRPGSPFKSLGELVKYAKENPDKISYGSAGLGSATHLTAEHLASHVGIKLKHVPYRSTVPALTATMANEVDLYLGDIGSALSALNSNAIRPLVTTGDVRSLTLPDVPTVIESGFPGFKSQLMVGMMITKGTPKSAVNQINAVVTDYIKSPEFKAKMDAAAQIPAPQTPEAFGKYIETEVTKWQKVATDISFVRED